MFSGIHSFRFRLTVWYLSLFSILFVLFSVFVYGGLSKSLEARVEETLASEADTAAGIFADEFTELKGDVQASANETVEAMKIGRHEVAILEGERVLAGRPSSPAGGARSTAERTVKVGGRAYRIVVSASLAPVADALRAALRIILVGLPLVIALAGLGGYPLAGRSLRPLSSMAMQARRITESSLHTRIEIGRAAEEMETLVAAFNELLARLDQSFESMRRFVADASHELRTPVSVIRGEADVALSHERTAEQYRTSLAIVLDESRRLSRLVEDLLNLARADAGGVRLQVNDFYLNELVSDCCRSVQALAGTPRLTLERPP